MPQQMMTYQWKALTRGRVLTVAVNPQDSHWCLLPSIRKEACNSVPSNHVRQTVESGGLLLWILAARHPVASIVYYDTILYLRIDDSDPPQKVERRIHDGLVYFANEWRGCRWESSEPVLFKTHRQGKRLSMNPDRIIRCDRDAYCDVVLAS